VYFENMKVFTIASIVIIFLAILLALPHPSDSVLGISVSQLGNGIKFENLGTNTCVVFVRYPSGADERIVLGAGQTEMLLNRPQPVDVSAVCK